MTELFYHEKLDVYRAALEFVAWSHKLLGEVRGSRNPLLGEVAQQLDRAGLSILLNTAEGNGKRQRSVRAKFFDDARGSAAECAACLDALVAKEACARERVADGKALLGRISAMLTKLVQRYSDEGRVREAESEYLTLDEGQAERGTDEGEGEFEGEGD